MFTDTRKFKVLIGLICFFMINILFLDIISLNADMFSSSINKHFLFDETVLYNEYIKVFGVLFNENSIEIDKFISSIYRFNNIFCKLIIFIVILNFVSYIFEERYHDSVDKLNNSSWVMAKPLMFFENMKFGFISIGYKYSFSFLLSFFKIILIIYIFNIVCIFVECFKFYYFISKCCNISVFITIGIDIIMNILYIITMVMSKKKVDLNII